MMGYCPECGNLKEGCENIGCSPLHIPRTVDNSLWRNCFVVHRNYNQAEKNSAIRRQFLDMAFFREISYDADGPNLHVIHMKSLDSGGSPKRAQALIGMLEYNNAARAHGPGWIEHRNEDIKYIQGKNL